MANFARLMPAVALLLYCMAAWAAQAAGQVTGTATYRERLALPPDAVFEATLVDVSKVDIPAEVIGWTRIERPGNPPIRFDIMYDTSRIDPSHRYAVRAHILVGGKLFFVTDRNYSVLTAGQGNEVALLLRRAGGSDQADQSAGTLVDLPATYTGILPCADCPGIRYQLELFPDEAFFLRMTYLGKADGDSVDDIGSWIVARDRRTLTLFGGGEASLKFAIKDTDTLRKLDMEGGDIVSSHNYDLRRTADTRPLEPRVPMRGLYKYFADAGQFTECLTGKNWPVAQEGENAVLESAYSKTRRQAGEELLVTLQGQVAMRPKMEGEGKQPTLVIDRFIGVWPGESCGSRYSTEPLENTYWKLTRLGEAPVVPAAAQQEPHIILHPQSRSISGSGGCNRLLGGYELKGDQLIFGQMASTMMACADGMETEKAFLEALTRVDKAKIVRQHLEMFDRTGNVVARFEARHMK